MTRTEKNVALFLAASAVGALVLVACQEVAGGVLARVLDLPEGAVWGGLGLRRFTVFKLGLFLAVVPWVLHEAGGECSPRSLAPLPVFGYPGWFPGNERESFYADTRHFRPFRRAAGAVESARESARQPLRASAEESPGSVERDAG